MSAPAYAPGCTGKIPHKTKHSAARQAKHSNHGKAYRCNHCGLWHVGNGRVQPSKGDRAFLAKLNLRLRAT